MNTQRTEELTMDDLFNPYSEMYDEGSQQLTIYNNGIHDANGSVVYSFN